MAGEIRAVHIDEAEQRIARIYQLVAGADSNDKVLLAARTDPEGFLKFAQYHAETLFKQYLPDIDPRQEPAIMTMLRHFFAVGAVAQRLSEGDDGD